jgi:hypothetical protein
MYLLYWLQQEVNTRMSLEKTAKLLPISKCMISTVIKITLSFHGDSLSMLVLLLHAGMAWKWTM